jgi:hypothetical protein
MLDNFEPAGLKLQMFMAADEEMRALSTTDGDYETQANPRTSVWEHLTDALASLNEYVSRRRSKPMQTPMSASPEC